MENFTNPLDNLKIASPCSADWTAMIGDERQRFCGECKMNVYNLSGMTRREAENLLENSEGRLCVRFYKRADGTVLTKDCPVGWAKVKRKISRTAAAAFSLLMGIFGGIFAFSSFGKNETVTMGEVVESNTSVTNTNSFSTPQPRTTMGNVAVKEIQTVEMMGAAMPVKKRK